MARPPTPTALKLVTGNPGKRALNGKEPEPDALLELAPPAHLTPRSAAVWNELAPMLRKMKVLTVADVLSLELLCDAVADYREARDQRGSVLVKLNSKTGAEMLSQLHVSQQMSRKAIESLGGKFGLSPRDRAGLTIDPQGDFFGNGDGGGSDGPDRFFTR